MIALLSFTEEAEQSYGLEKKKAMKSLIPGWNDYFCRW